MAIDLALLFGTLLLLIALGAPVFLAMAGATGAYALVFPGKLPTMVVAQTFVQGIDSYNFAAIPFFLLAGAIMSAGGMAQRLLDFAMAAMGHVRGGLAQVNIATNVAMAGVSGSAVADAAAIGGIMAPAMTREGYPPAYAAALTAAAATIGPVIPPSIPMLVFALFTGTPIVALFLGGLLPGLLMGLSLVAVCAWQAGRRGFPKGHWRGWDEIGRSGRRAVLALVMPLLVLLALRSGAATATEIGAVMAGYAALVSVVAYRTLGLRDLWHVVVDSALDTARLLIIVSSAGAFTWIMASIGVGTAVAGWITSVTDSITLVLLLVALVLLVMGMVLDPVTMLLLIGPVMVPTIAALGGDPVHFGVVMVLGTVLGLITPPVGVLLFITGTQARADMARVAREVAPFTLALALILVLVILVPGLATWLGRV